VALVAKTTETHVLPVGATIFRIASIKCMVALRHSGRDRMMDPVAAVRSVGLSHCPDAPMRTGWPKQPAVQSSGQGDQDPTQAGSPGEVRGEFPVDLQWTPVIAFPLTEAPGQLWKLIGPDSEQRAIAGRADLDLVARTESEAVPAADMGQPSVREIESVRRLAQSGHHWADIKVGHVRSSIAIWTGPRGLAGEDLSG